MSAGVPDPGLPHTCVIGGALALSFSCFPILATAALSTGVGLRSRETTTTSSLLGCVLSD